MIFGQHVVVLAQDADRVAQKIAEVAGIQRLQPLLVGAIELAALAIGEGARVALGNFVRSKPLVLPAVDHLRELARRPALVVEVLGLDELLQEPDLVVGVENGEVRLQPGEFGVAAQDLDADRVERAEPGHALDGLADQQADAHLHLARRLVGEGHREDLRGKGAAGGEDMGDARRQHTRLAGAGAGEHQNRSLGSFDGKALLRVEAGEIVGCGAAPCGHGTRGNARAAALWRAAGGAVEKGHVVRKIGHFIRM